MSRPKTDSPKLYFHKNSGWWCVNLDGNRKKLSKDHASAVPLHREAVGRWLLGGTAAPNSSAAIRNSSAAIPATVASALEAYLAHVEPHLSEGQRWRVGIACEEATLAFGRMSTARFDQLALQEVRARLLARKARGGKSRPLARSYINALIGALQTAWTWCVSQKLAPDGSDVALRSVRPLDVGRGGRETAAVQPPPSGAVEDTLGALRPDLGVMVRLQRLTGMRPGEVCRFRPCDLSRSPDAPVRVPIGGGKFSEVTATVIEGALIWAFAPATHKTLRRGKTRVVPIGPAAQALLAPLLATATDPGAYLFRPRARRGRTQAERWTTASYRQAVQKAAKKAGGAEWTPGQLRHEKATVGASQGDREQLAALLGHANPSMTAHYVATTFALAAQLAAKAG